MISIATFLCYGPRTDLYLCYSLQRLNVRIDFFEIFKIFIIFLSKSFVPSSKMAYQVVLWPILDIGANMVLRRLAKIDFGMLSTWNGCKLSNRRLCRTNVRRFIYACLNKTNNMCECSLNFQDILRSISNICYCELYKLMRTGHKHKLNRNVYSIGKYSKCNRRVR